MCLRLCRHSDNVPELSDLIKQTFSFVCIESEYTFSACTFCFPILDHVMLLEGIVSFKCRLMHVQIYA